MNPPPLPRQKDLRSDPAVIGYSLPMSTNQTVCHQAFVTESCSLSPCSKSGWQSLRFKNLNRAHGKILTTRNQL